MKKRMSDKNNRTQAVLLSLCKPRSDCMSWLCVKIPVSLL